MKALTALEKLLPEAPAEIRTLPDVHHTASANCWRAHGRFYPEEHYDYAISAEHRHITRKRGSS